MSKIKANIIMEIMGRPPEHIKEALNTVVVKMGSEKGVLVLNKKYHEPKEMEKAKNLFTTFAEIDIEFDNLERFFSILMGYMPSNVEVYQPGNFKFDLYEINSLGNFILSKLHRYDEIAKQVIFERDILLRQLEHIKNGGKIEDLMPAVQNARKDEASKKESAVKKKKIKKK